MNQKIFDLNGSVIVVTGAAGMLGRYHVEAIAAFGGNPVLIDLNEERVKNIAHELNVKYGVSATGYSVDITSENQLLANTEYLLDEYGKIDGLVNNAANNPNAGDHSMKSFSRLENFPLEVWEADLSIGLTGAFLCTKHYGTAISKNPNGGVIINVSSDLGLIAPDQRLYSSPELAEDQQPVKPVTYSIVKTGVVGLTRYISTYWPERVRCNALCPGGVESGQTDEFIQKVNSRIPMGRLAQANEYQGVLIFLLSDASKYLNGAIIPMEGGRCVW